MSTQKAKNVFEEIAAVLHLMIHSNKNHVSAEQTIKYERWHSAYNLFLAKNDEQINASKSKKKNTLKNTIFSPYLRRYCFKIY